MPEPTFEEVPLTLEQCQTFNDLRNWVDRNSFTKDDRKFISIDGVLYLKDNLYGIAHDLPTPEGMRTLRQGDGILNVIEDTFKFTLGDLRDGRDRHSESDYSDITNQLRVTINGTFKRHEIPFSWVKKLEQICNERILEIFGKGFTL